MGLFRTPFFPGHLSKQERGSSALPDKMERDALNVVLGARRLHAERALGRALDNYRRHHEGLLLTQQFIDVLTMELLAVTDGTMPREGLYGRLVSFCAIFGDAQEGTNRDAIVAVRARMWRAAEESRD